MMDSERLDVILNELLDMKTDLVSVKDNVSFMKVELSSVKKDTTDIKLIIENEIRTNIQRVAEGHLDLSRNLHDAMKPSNEIEMLAIKVRMLETDMREVKSKIS